MNQPPVTVLYPFTVGVAFCRSKYQWSYQMPTWLALVIMVILVSAVCSIRIPVWGYVYVPLMIYLFCQLQFPKWLNSVLMELGRKSMAIWMIHTWFCCYLFREEVYSLKYPVFILGAILIISYLDRHPIHVDNQEALDNIESVIPLALSPVSLIYDTYVPCHKLFTI